MSPQGFRIPFYRSVAAKVLGVLALIVVAVSVVSGFYAIRGARVLLTEQLTERGLVLTRNLSFNAGYGVYTGDTFTLNQLLGGVMAEDDVLFAVVTDAGGKVLAKQVRPGREALLAALVDRLAPGEEERVVEEEGRDGQGDTERFLLLSTPVTSSQSVLVDQESLFLQEFLGRTFSPDEMMLMPREEVRVFRGTVHLGLSRADIESGMGNVAGQVTLLSLVVIGVGIGMSWILVRLLTQPLHRVTQMTSRVADGDLDAKVEVYGRDEVALLGTAFNKMTDALAGRDEEIRRAHRELEHSNRELADLNAHLEERVNKRTRELKKSNKALEATNRELVTATERKSRFMANLAHELRTPLNSVIGFSEALRDGLLGELTKKQLKYVNNIVTSGRHILDMSGGILDLSKIEAGTIDVRLETLDPIQFLEEIVTITEPQLSSKSLSVDLDTSGLDLSRTYLVDRGKFKQVLYNLVSNAIKFSPENGRILLSCSTVGEEIELRVHDAGPGVPEEERESIFEEFSQLDPGKTVGGSGLGLSITRKLVELHGGSIRVETAPEGGAAFVVRLPENPPPVPGTVPVG